MNDRIRRMVERVQKEELNPKVVQVEFDPFDEKLAEPMRIAKRLTEFLNAQEPFFPEESNLIGVPRLSNCPVPGDIFTRSGHPAFREAVGQYYNKPQENLCTLEWQHSNANFEKVIRLGLNGYIREINRARKNFLGRRDNLAFLAALEMMIRGISLFADKCRTRVLNQAGNSSDPERRQTLLRLAEHCLQVPMNPARTFEEAVQCVFFCFEFLPDSIGRADQYLHPFFRKEIDDHTLTRDHAKELLQELFIHIHAHTPNSSGNSDRGAESHFVVGGYTRDHEDGYNELSELILESMMELPLERPQVSLRWTNKTPRAILRRTMDRERHDPKKRIAFVNDEPRIASMLKINHLPFEVACDYIMVGCNEPAYQGGISLGGNTCNIVRSLLNTLNKRRSEILECPDFDAFYTIYEQEFFKDLELMLEYSNRFNILRSRDCNVLSSLFLEGCIERAESATRGGAKLARGGGVNLMGGTNLIDSLTVIRQFVYDEKRVTLERLLAALDADWKGAEDLRLEILRDGRFFGNHDEYSDSIARRLNESLYRFAEDRTDLFGTELTYGNLTGYNPHFAFFGSLTGATPDGRVAGSALTFGSGQVYGKELNGITSHLLSVAQMDPTGVLCGNTIMNLTVDNSTVRNEEGFEKLVLLIETYFKAGGLHIQLNYLSREELIAAKADQEKYKNLRVRVSGFSATFVKLNESLQENIIARTSEEVE